MQASIGCEQLKKLPNFIDKRRSNFQHLKQILSTIDTDIILPEASPNSNPSWFGFPITIRTECKKSRNSIIEYIEEHQIQTRLLFSGNLVKHPCFDEIRNTNAYRIIGDLENTNNIMNNTFWVGVYPGMTEEMIEYIGQTIIDAFMKA